MNCKECEKKIPNYIKNELEDEDLEDFIAHVEECPSCKEELSIQYLVTVGVMRLEDDGGFDLTRELDGKLNRNISLLHRNRNRNRLYVGLEFALIMVVALMSAFVLY